MSAPLRQQLEDALEELRAQQARMRAASEELAKTTATVTSKDRMIEATVDSRGRLTSIKLKGTGYRRLAPAELAARIVDIVRSAQDTVARRTAASLTGLLPAHLGQGIEPILSSDDGWDIDGMFEAAARAMREPLFAADAAPPGKDADRG